MDLCTEQDFIHCNSWFQKDIEEKITFRDIGTTETEEDLNWEKFAEIDHCITRRKWRNSIKDIEANRAIHTDSDHYPVIIRL